MWGSGLSEALDTIGHGALLGQLWGSGLGGALLHRFGSVLQGRYQPVWTGNERSSPRLLFCGLPWGLGLSRLLFDIHMKP